MSNKCQNKTVMASSLCKLRHLNGCISSSLIVSIRNGHHLRGKPPGVAKSLEQKLIEQRYKDPAIYFRVDIGLPPPQVSKSQRLQERLEIERANKSNPTLERLARNRELLVDLELLKQESLKTTTPHYIKTIADHYGVFEHLFGDAYFHPRIPLNVNFNLGDNVLPVYYGNVVKPSEAVQKPNVLYESDSNTFWSLVLTNPDGHLTKNNSEYVHWFVGNIPGNDIESGETIIEYLQPFPPKGTGYHRHIFILYKQEKKIDFSEFKKDGPCLALSERTFSTFDFYKNLQDDITPSGLVFFQSDWDKSLKDFYHHVLNMQEPIFEYDFPPPYIKKQKWFPLREPFNLYMDKYRDPKQVNKEYLVRKLKNVHPFKDPPVPLPYPNAQYWDGYVPTWLKLEIRKSRNKWGRIHDIE